VSDDGLPDLPDEAKAILRSYHERMMATDEVYRAGHNAEQRSECPHLQPESLQRELFELSCKKVLTDVDTARMGELHVLIDATEGQRWVRGFYSRPRKTALDFP